MHAKPFGTNLAHLRSANAHRFATRPCSRASSSTAPCALHEEPQISDERVAEGHSAPAADLPMPTLPALKHVLQPLMQLRAALRRHQPHALALCAAAVVAPGNSAGTFLSQLQGNYVFVVGFWAWASAQFMKIFTKRVKEGVWDITAVVDSGGMPSSHSALCMAVTTAVGHKLGLGSPIFAVALAFSLIVMYDAANVRWHAGKQAEVLNVVMADLLEGHPISEKKMKEVLGHTPLQVCAGAILGVLVGVFYPTPVTAFPV